MSSEIERLRDINAELLEQLRTSYCPGGGCQRGATVQDCIDDGSCDCSAGHAVMKAIGGVDDSQDTYAHLIAAAPALLAACIALTRDNDGPGEFGVALEQARAAIAKARTTRT